MSIASLVIVVFLFIYCFILLWKNWNHEDRWTKVCHSLSLSSSIPESEIFREIRRLKDIINDPRYYYGVNSINGD